MLCVTLPSDQSRQHRAAELFGRKSMSFTNQLITAFALAVAATLAMFSLGPAVHVLIEILRSNIIFTTAIGLPLATTVSMLIALLALQR